MSQLHEECGVAAVYHLPEAAPSDLCPGGPREASRLLPRMLLDIQNRGQLAAGITTYSNDRDQLIDTHKELGSVSEAFRLSHQGKYESLMARYYGHAGIGHVRYATCGKNDRSYAQPFERHHLQKNKWFSFAFNGQLANYGELREKLLEGGDHHLARETDTEIIMHEISRVLSSGGRPSMMDVLRDISQKFDGAYSLVMLNALGEMCVARDPLGIKPLCYARDESLLAAASESVALVNLGFRPDQVLSLEPGYAISIVNGEIRKEQFAESTRSAHCFFEWIYFANVASKLDDRSVYLTRTALGEELAELEIKDGRVPLDDDQTIVVPVPDTSKAAADAMAHRLGIPSREGLIRNRYSGRTFIEGSSTRKKAVQSKYTPLRDVLGGKRVLLVEDSIVRSTTMRVLLNRIRQEGEAREIHVRVACPPIVAPCFYGIDMSRVDELFAPRFLENGVLTDAGQQRMAEELGADSLRYLPVESISRAVAKPEDALCQGCITGKYPSPRGQELYQVALDAVGKGEQRTYESARPSVVR
ncbi:MAG: amidophosphoribosyltransferase [Planctomycetota bacterium]